MEQEVPTNVSSPGPAPTTVTQVTVNSGHLSDTGLVLVICLVVGILFLALVVVGGVYLYWEYSQGTFKRSRSSGVNSPHIPSPRRTDSVKTSTPGTEERHTPLYAAPTPPSTRTTADSGDVENQGQGQSQGRPPRNLGTPPRFVLEEQHDTPLQSSRQQGTGYGTEIQGYQAAAAVPSPQQACIKDLGGNGDPAVVAGTGDVELQLIQGSKGPVSAAAVAALAGATASLNFQSPAVADTDNDSFHTTHSRTGISKQSSQSDAYYTPYDSSRQASQLGSGGGAPGIGSQEDLRDAAATKTLPPSPLSRVVCQGPDSDYINSSAIKNCVKSEGMISYPITADIMGSRKDMQYISTGADGHDEDGVEGLGCDLVVAPVAVAAAPIKAAAGIIETSISGKSRARTSKGAGGVIPVNLGQGLAGPVTPTLRGARPATKSFSPSHTTKATVRGAAGRERDATAIASARSCQPKIPVNPAVSSSSFRAAIAEAKRTSHRYSSSEQHQHMLSKTPSRTSQDSFPGSPARLGIDMLCSATSSPRAGASVLFAYTDRDGNPFVQSPRASVEQAPSPFCTVPNMGSPRSSQEEVMSTGHRPPSGRFAPTTSSHGSVCGALSGGGSGAAPTTAIGMHVLRHANADKEKDGSFGGVDKSAASLRSTGSSLPEMVLPMPPCDRSNYQR